MFNPKKLIYDAGQILTAFVPDKMLRKKIRTSFNLNRKHSTMSPYMINPKYGKIYYPPYKKTVYSNEEPAIFNSEGQPIRTFFIRDTHLNNFDDRTTKYFLWDRFNFGLDVHFYTHASMLETMGNPKKRYGLFIESEVITPFDYQIFDKNKGLEKDFDLIFTHTGRFLDKFDNARPLPYLARIWYSLKNENGELDPNWYEYKTKNLSIVSSRKIMCDFHKLRIDWARQIRANGWGDAFGTFDGGKLINIGESLKNYRFSIAIENEIEPYWFTEKLLNCLASMTIPVYIGATNLSEYFNMDGIIQVHPKDYKNLEKIVKMCTKEEYDSRLEAVKDNFYRALQFENINNYMYEKYLKDDLALNTIDNSPCVLLK